MSNLINWCIKLSNTLKEGMRLACFARHLCHRHNQRRPKSTQLLFLWQRLAALRLGVGASPLKIILLLLASVFWWSCVPSQSTSTPPAHKRSVKFLLEQLDSNHIDYTWFATKAKIKYEDKKQKATFTAIIRMQKDSLIWIALKKSSVEGARVRITPNNIEILDRQQSTYTKKPFSYLKSEYGLDLTFVELQDLIIGNPILLANQNFISTILEKKNVLQTPESQKTVLKIFLSPPNFLIHEIRASANNNAISIEYSEYQDIQNQQIAAHKEVEIDSEDIGIIGLKMSFSDIVLDEVQKVGFEVPESYGKN